MSWKQNITFDDRFKLLYKGIDMGVSPEFIQDLMANNIFVTDELIYKDFEEKYNSHLSVIRGKKLDIILGQDEGPQDDSYNP
jgi:hypothetical protein